MLSRLSSVAARTARGSRQMSKTVGIVTEKPFAAAAVNQIKAVFDSAGYDVKLFEGDINHEEIIKGLDGCIVRSDKITAGVMDAGADNLKIVVRAGAGVDTIDLDAATERNIVIQNTPGQNANAVAELAFGMMLTNARNHYNGTSGYELKGKTLALYGYGAVAQQMHKLATGFEMDVWAYDPFVDAAKLEAAGAKPITAVPDLFDANFVSLHCPLTDDTRASIGKELMTRMPQKGAVINTARKEVIDEDGLVEAFAERNDLRLLSDVKPGNEDAMNAAGGGMNAFSTAKKMGAQTGEANVNAGVAAAHQIVNFLENGENPFQVNKPGKTF
jgi:D-3-phosphoglycerate dehydrogenase